MEGNLCLASYAMPVLVVYMNCFCMIFFIFIFADFIDFLLLIFMIKVKVRADVFL